MDDLKSLFRDLRVCFTLVPWRMRSRLIFMLLGSIGVALIDMAAVVLMLPVMQLISGTPIDDSQALKFISNLSGISETRSLLFVALGLVLALMMAKTLLTLAFRWWSVGVINRAKTDATETLMSLFMNSPWESHRRRVSGDIITALQTYTAAAFSGATQALIQALVDGTLVLAILVALLAISPSATLMALLFFGGSALLLQSLLRNRLIDLGESIRTANLRSWDFLTPAISGFKQARLSGAIGYFTRGFINNKRVQNTAERKAALLDELPRHLLEILMVLGIGLLCLILLSTTGEREAFSIIGVFAVASIRMVPALNRVVGTLGTIRGDSKNVAALSELVIELRGEVGRENPSEQSIQYPDDDICVQNVQFQFADAAQPLLKGVSTTIKRGTTVALVGSSGAGKTTFVDLVTALYSPTRGEISVGGVSIHANPISWRHEIGVVPQDVFIWAETLRRNIAYGLPDEEIDEERIRHAISMAQLDDVVSELADGLDTRVGYDGVRLSGGQKQRVGIARALYSRPSILVLDEATSALDNLTEAKFTATIDALRGSMTIIVVAHRLSTVRNADEILFFSDGHIAARGTMDELREDSEEFRELVRLGTLFG